MEEYTVTKLSALIKRSIEQNFDNICLKAEISALKLHSSGHAYFTLKDEESVIDAVCWKWALLKQKTKLVDGMKIKCIGQVTTYPKSSKYQFNVKAFEPEGIGELLKMLEERKQRLAKEGLFDASRKKPIPKIPRLIGIITSPTGAVIKDMMHRLTQRFPRDILLWPVNVQGVDAVNNIVHAIEGFNNLTGEVRPDVLIVARGGGSFEDLMPFNDEAIVRAVVASDIPIISAVGHETDTTLIDYASDLRAPTPTAAAEFAVPERVELASQLSRIFSQLNQAIISKIKHNKLLLSSNKIMSLQNIIMQKAQLSDFTFEKLISATNKNILDKKIRISNVKISAPKIDFKTDEIYNKLIYLTSSSFDKFKMKFQLSSQALENCSYSKILDKGFALVETGKGRPITSAETAMSQTYMELVFSDGKVTVQRKPTQTTLF